MATFVKDMVHEAVHSVLVAIDGGSASAEIGRVQLVSETGVPLGDALHEMYVDYLLETGRNVLSTGSQENRQTPHFTGQPRGGRRSDRRRTGRSRASA
jgi:hypothetical protein